ncbi:hypothetical protein AGRA3207_005581 [Actinomadura graeca]|uniref:Alkylmercury lyase n=1 Tax=Actinomadura graeca TaxID=2750812 RepID=A0ABX8QZV7_9ACTN|nr:organomercurial lyase [Actinomadura graeca]QXJ24290.1 hypothetical protein AGRA3207_005581 [Actinomadura graeca]
MTEEPAGGMVEDVRLAIYRGFAEEGSALRPGEIAAHLGITADEVRRAMRALHASRDIVLDAEDGDRVVLAHPFTSVPLGFSVMGRDTLWWGGCAWDSFAMPHLLPDEPEVLVATRCPACGTAHAWAVGRDAPPSGGQVAHFLTPVQRVWDDVVRSCANQRLFCSDDCVRAWLERTGHEHGYTMDLATLWRLARNWYTGRLERGYRRREPSAASAYFAEVGLRGPFWGLPAR